MPKAVFVTNDALSGHIGTAQILPYLEGLASLGHSVDCLSVEPRTSEWDPSDDWKARLAKSRIRHHLLRRSTGKLYAMERFLVPGRLRRRLERVIEKERPDLLHCRSYMPLSAVMRVGARHKLPFLFDMRGFWIDQRIEGEFWNMRLWVWQQVERRLRAIESRAIAQARAIVTLTADARDIVLARPDYRGAIVEVIPSSVRGDIFCPRPDRRESRARLGIASQDCVIAYLGSAGPLYRLDIVYRLWRAMIARGLSAVVLFIGDHNLQQHATAAARVSVALDPSRVYFVKCSHHEIPSVLAAADIGVSPIIPSFSSLGVSATKVGEYLSCGLPVVTNAGVGDAQRIVENGKNGFVLPNFDDVSIAQCAAAVHEGLRGGFLPAKEISRRAGLYFGMERAVAAYDALYRRVCQSD